MFTHKTLFQNLMPVSCGLWHKLAIMQKQKGTRFDGNVMA
uniref:Uncharacterized protein n=1 Tax=Anguilla anguilla TaxID=7936 RepID=A0A0E9WSF4_ANGAN